MDFLKIYSVLLVGFSLFTVGTSNFQNFYSYLWGTSNFRIDPQGTQVQLQMYQSSGAGFRSNLDYGSGVFHISMKLPQPKTEGIVTTFYLTAAPDNNQDPGNHFEIDFEFLGTNGTLQTNVYNNDRGGREQSFKLWFDPSADFHSYEFIWNFRQIVFLVDKIPIRVFKNNQDKGIEYPTLPMHAEASIWNANWAGNVDWSKAPFVAEFRDFDFYGCPARGFVTKCAPARLYWNRPNYLELSERQKQIMRNFRRLYMTYDYCSQLSTRKPECSYNDN